MDESQCIEHFAHCQRIVLQAHLILVRCVVINLLVIKHLVVFFNTWSHFLFYQQKHGTTEIPVTACLLQLSAKVKVIETCTAVYMHFKSPRRGASLTVYIPYKHTELIWPQSVTLSSWQLREKVWLNVVTHLCRSSPNRLPQTLLVCGSVIFFMNQS